MEQDLRAVGDTASRAGDYIDVSREIGSGHRLLARILRFGRLLRLTGVATSLQQMLDLVEALRYLPVTDRDGFYYAARAVLASRHEDWPLFDQAFALFWLLRGEQAEQGRERHRTGDRLLRLPAEEGREGILPHLQGVAQRVGPEEDDADGVHPTPIYSPAELLRRKDFAEMSWEEVHEARRAIAAMQWRPADRLTRRHRPARKGRLDLRALLRASMRHCGEPLALCRRTRLRRPRPLVVLCDVSGSMERYSRMLLHFAHSLSHGLPGVRVESFVFGTRLTRITHHLRHRDVDDALEQAGQAVPDWGGGTRIGEAIRAFNFRWARRVLGSGAVVLIISDGWDRGNVRLLSDEMARLQRSVHRLLWLNPVAGSRQYAPVQHGMAAALPYVDGFLAGNNLASLERLSGLLSSVAASRPARRQHPLLPARSPEEPPTDGPGRRSPQAAEVMAEYPIIRLVAWQRGDVADS